MEEQKNQLALINEQVSTVTKGISSIKGEITDAIADNNKSLQACISAGEALMARADEKMDDELDSEIATYLKKGKATVKVMSERRKGVTQVFDLVKKGFTTMEGFLNIKDPESILYKLQKKRDDYAAYKLEQQRKAEAERQRQARITAQKEQVAADTNKVCSDILTLQSQSATSSLREIFSQITLDNKDAKKKEIQDFPDTLNIVAFLKHTELDKNVLHSPTEIVVDNYLDTKYVDLTEEEIRNGRNNAYKSCFAQYVAQYKQTIDQTKQELLDTFDSKIAELKEAKRLEEERKRKEEEARKAEEERKRKEEEARKKAEEAKRIADEEARKKAEEEAKKAAEAAAKAAEESKAKAEAEAIAAEKSAKHDAEVKAAEDAAAKEQSEKLKAEAEARKQEQQIQQARGQAQSLFNEASISAPVKAKVTKHIEIDSPTAFLDIIQLWWTHEGSQMNVEQLSKKLGFMVKACEKLANKEDITLTNDAIRYVEDVVAK